MSSPKLYRHVWVWTRLAVSARVSTIAVGVAIGRKVGSWPILLKNLLVETVKAD